MGNTTKSAARKIGLVLGCILILILGFLIWRAFFCPMAEGVSIGGVDLSGLSAAKARKALSDTLDQTLYAQPLTVELPEGTPIIPFSAEKGNGRDDLVRKILDAVGE